MYALDNCVAVLGFSDKASPIPQAWPSTHRAMLPVGAKAVIVHVVEQLSGLGVRHVRISGALQQLAIRRRLADGCEWGVRIRYSDLHGADLRMQTLIEHGRCIYLPADQMLDLDGSLAAHSDPTMARVEGSDNLPSCWQLDRDGTRRTPIARNEGCEDALLADAGGYHAANRKAAARRYLGPCLPGIERATGAQIDWDSRIHSTAQLDPSVIVGKQCLVSRHSVLADYCVVGHGSMIGRYCHLHNVVVLPNTFIGPGTRLRDAIVAPTGVFDLTGQFWPARDRTQIARARSNAEATTGLPDEHLSVVEQGHRTTTFL